MLRWLGGSYWKLCDKQVEKLLMICIEKYFNFPVPSWWWNATQYRKWWAVWRCREITTCLWQKNIVPCKKDPIFTAVALIRERREMFSSSPSCAFFQAERNLTKCCVLNKDCCIIQKFVGGLTTWYCYIFKRKKQRHVNYS